MRFWAAAVPAAKVSAGMASARIILCRMAMCSSDRIGGTSDSVTLRTWLLNGARQPTCAQHNKCAHCNNCGQCSKEVSEREAQGCHDDLSSTHCAQKGARA